MRGLVDPDNKVPLLMFSSVLGLLFVFMLLYIIGCIWSDKLIETHWDTLKTDSVSEELDGFPENLGRTFVPPRKSTLSACFVLS